MKMQEECERVGRPGNLAEQNILFPAAVAEDGC